MGLRQAPQNGLGVAPLPGWLSQTVGHAMACASSYCSGTSTAIAHMCLGCTVSACQTAANVQLQNGLILKGINAATQLFRLQSKGIA